jgi:hypothetical protein
VQKASHVEFVVFVNDRSKIGRKSIGHGVVQQSVAMSLHFNKKCSAVFY